MKLPYADKKFGQHFLTNQQVIKMITQDFAQSTDAILEIGPGPGILTKELIKLSHPFAAIEKDQRLAEYLIPKILTDDQIYFADALDVDLNKFIKTKLSNALNVWLVSNLPYNVSTPLTIKFLKTIQIKYMTLMYQKEVADKILNSKEQKDNNSLHMLCYSFFTVTPLCKVKPGSFSPPPKVDSMVLSFSRRSKPLIKLEDFVQFETFLRRLFSQRRKQLQKVLRQYYPLDKLLPLLEKLIISPTIRAEVLSEEEVIQLYYQITQL